jgi:hypothetical protein
MTVTWNGWYLNVEYHRIGAEPWFLDLRFVDDPVRQPDLAHRRDLTPRLIDRPRDDTVTLPLERHV